jgi:Spy/CpxP family protein refolding chaperone
MKKINIWLTISILSIFAVSCSQTSKAPKGNSETQEKAAESQASTPENDQEKSLNAGDRLGSQLDELGESLTADQRAKLDELSRKYDLSRSGSQDERRAMRQQMQNEVNNILTPEQRAKLEQNRKARKGASGN